MRTSKRTLWSTAACAVALAATAPAAAQAAPVFGTDQFDGSSLDARWSVLRSFPAGLNVANGKLNLELREGDMIGGTASAQNVVLQETPDSGWVATAKLSIADINANGEQAGLVYWRGEGAGQNAFGKVVFIQNNSGGRGFENIVTDQSTTAHPTGNSSVPAPAGLPADAEVLIRARSDSRTIVSEYSADDGQTWTKIARDAVYTGPVKVGLMAIRGGTGGGFVGFDSFTLEGGPEVTLTPSATSGASPLAVSFDGEAPDGATLAWDFGDGETATGEEDRQHTYAEPGAYRATLAATAGGITTRRSVVVGTDRPAEPCLVDNFNGSAIHPGWEVRRPIQAGVTVGGGMLRLQGTGGDMHSGNASARNLLLQTAPTGPWTATLKLDTSALNGGNDQAGMVAWRSEGPNNFTKLVFNKRGGANWWVERANTVNGSASGSNTPERSTPLGTLYLRIVSDGAANPSLTAFSSVDGSTWTAEQGAFQLGGSGPIKVGLGFFGAQSIRMAGFDSFKLQGPDCDAAAPVTTHTLAPADPDGSDGWYTASPQVTLAATDAGGSVAKTEYRIGNGAYQRYTAPFTAPGEGNHTVTYRSIDTAGNVEAEKTVQVKVDATDPATTATLDPAAPPAGGVYDTPVEVTLNGTDAGSGVKTIQYRVDGETEWKTYSGPLSEGQEEVIFNGTQASLDQWLMAPSGSFRLEGDAMEGVGGLGMLWFPKAYGDFSVKLQFRDVRTGADHSNGGVFVRFPDPRIPNAQRDWQCNVGNAQTSAAWVGIFCGHEIQLYDGTTGETQKTGSIYNFDPLSTFTASKPKGEWNDYEIRVVGQQYTIIRNGVVINEFDNGIDKASSRGGDPPTQHRRFAQGFIGLQNHGTDDHMQYRNIRVTPLSAGTGPFTIAGDGDHEVEFRSIDNAGREEAVKTVEFSIDKPDTTPPVTSHALNPEAPPAGSAGWYRGDVAVTLTGTDDEEGASGFDRTQYKLDGAAEWTLYGGPVTVTGDGAHVLQYRSIDKSNNPETPKTVTIKIDATGPSASTQLDPADPGGQGGWYLGPVSLAVAAQDGSGSGVARIEYRYADNVWRSYGGALGFADGGVWDVEARAVDVAGNVGAVARRQVRIDASAPVTTATLEGEQADGAYTGPVEVALAASDASGSGVDYTELRVDGGDWQAYGAAVAVSGLGEHAVEYRSVDLAGNLEGTRTARFVIAERTATGETPPTQRNTTPAPVPATWLALDLDTRKLPTVKGFRAGGLTVEGRCGGADAGTASLKVSRKLAKRLKLRGTTLATGKVACGEDRRWSVRLKPGKAARKALKRARGDVRATLTVRFTGAGAPAQDKTTVVFDKDSK